jgi:hypothetical protein
MAQLRRCERRQPADRPERTGAVARRHQHRLYVPDVQPGPRTGVSRPRSTPRCSAPWQRSRRRRQPAGRALLPSRAVEPQHGLRDGRPAGPGRAKLRVAVRPRARATAAAHAALPSRAGGLSTGDRRGSAARDGPPPAGLPACAAYAPALVERRRSLAGLAPLSWIAVAGGAVWAAVRRHPGRSASASTAVALAASRDVALSAAPSGRPRSAREPATRARQRPPAPGARGRRRQPVALGRRAAQPCRTGGARASGCRCRRSTPTRASGSAPARAPGLAPAGRGPASRRTGCRSATGCPSRGEAVRCRRAEPASWASPPPRARGARVDGRLPAGDRSDLVVHPG